MPYILSIFFIISIATLYSAADGIHEPWAFNQVIRYMIGVGVMFLTMRLPRPFFYAWSYPFYLFCLIALILVEAMGFVGMGAKRWLKVAFFSFQPSELMRIAMILALALYLGDFKHQIKKMRTLWVPLIIVLIPVILIVRQPDLGTALLILGSSLFYGFDIRHSAVEIWCGFWIMRCLIACILAFSSRLSKKAPLSFFISRNGHEECRISCDAIQNCYWFWRHLR